MKRLPIFIFCQRSSLKITRYVAELLGFSKQIYFEHRVTQYRDMWRLVANDLDAEFQELSSDFWQIAKGNNSVKLHSYRLPLDNPVVLGLAGKKPVVFRILQDNNIPIPDHLSFNLSKLDQAYEFLGKHRDGCVVKPANGYGGKGVTVNISDNKLLKNAAILASLYSPEILIEEQIAGESFRLLIFNGKMIDAVKRNGLRLHGDGKSTIRQLLRNHESYSDGLENDQDINFMLKLQKLDWDFIVRESQSLLVKSKSLDEIAVSELRTVYDENVTENVCSEIIKYAEDTARLVDSKFLGVDIISTDISKDLRDTGGIINEVNTTPALHHHYNSRTEQYPQAALTIIKTLLEDRAA